MKKLACTACFFLCLVAGLAGGARAAGETPDKSAAQTAPAENSGNTQVATSGGNEGGKKEPTEAEKREAERKMRTQLLDQSIDALLPVKPDELRRYIQERDQVQNVIEPGPATMLTQSRNLTITPTAAPQVIRLTRGYSSTLVFQDMTGAAWPVLATVVGDETAFQLVQPKATTRHSVNRMAAIRESGTRQFLADPNSTSEDKAQDRISVEDDIEGSANTNIINILPLTSHASSNLIVTLDGAPYPILIHLLTESAANSKRRTDAMVTFRLDRPGPSAKLPDLSPSKIASIAPEMLSLVHGIPPEGAQRVKLSPAPQGVDLYHYRGKYYLRSPHSIVWPAWDTVISGEDVKVYGMQVVPSIVLSIEGKHFKALVKQGERK